jgi:hypothetical protein
MTELVHRDMLEVLADLPELCAARLNSTGQPILLKRGHRGYWPFRHDLDVKAFNEHHKVTPRQVEAMEIGSLVGFDVPGADVRNLKEDAAPHSYDEALVARWNAALADGSWVDLYKRPT